jgi:PAS domain S-box-containing protein
MKTFNQTVKAAQDRLTELLARIEHPDADHQALVEEATEALSNSLQELHVAQEELQAQNEELQATREQLEAERQRYQTLFDFAPDGYLVTDTGGVIQKANRAAADLLGLPPDHLVGKPLALFVAKADQPAFYARLNQTRTGTAERSAPHELHMAPRQGEGFYAALTVAPARDERGDVVELRWLIRDVTARRQAEQALRESEARFDLFMRHLPAAVYIKDRNERIIYANRTFADILGLKAEELVGADAGEMAPPDLREQYRAENRRVLQGETVETETTFPGVAGPTHWLVYKFPLPREGKPALIGTVALDITARKRAEQALRESERKYRTLFENTLNPILVVDEHSRYVDANAAALAFLECEQEELLSKTVWDFAAPGTLDEVQEEHLPFMNSRTVETDYFVNGRIKTLLLNVVPVALGQQRRLYGIGQDITERKRTVQALRESKNKYQSLYNSIRDAILVADTDRRIIDCNPAFTELFGYTLEEIRGKRTLHVYADREAFEKLGQTLRQRVGDANFFVTVPYEKKSGEIFPGETNVFPLKDAAGETQGFIGLIRDVTERQAAQEQIQHYAAELERSNRELEQFAYAVSHDLQAPLRTIRGFLELFAQRYRGTLDTRADDYIERIMEADRRMQAMIQALLNLSRVETRGGTPAPTDVEAILAHARLALQHAIETSGAEISHGPLPTVWADADQLTQVFQNLLANAIKFRRDGVAPRIHVSAERRDDVWRFTVADNGIGIDPAQADRIFQVFQRLHTEEEYPGIGIGLALCRRIVERHGGRIWVASTPGEGATFKFTLPVAETQSPVSTATEFEGADNDG